MPERLRAVLIRIYNRWLAFRASRERSVKNVARGNTRAGFQKIFSAEDLLQEYLSTERLAFFGEVAELVVPFQPRSVIDVGCGTGHLLAAVIERVPTVDTAVGVDYADSAIDRLRETVPMARGVVAPLEELSTGDERFDLVLCTEVLEHLDRPYEALQALLRLRAPGGRIVITVPDGEVDTYEGHRNFWSASDFESLLSTVGRVRVTRSTGNDLIGVIEPE